MIRVHHYNHISINNHIYDYKDTCRQDRSTCKRKHIEPIKGSETQLTQIEKLIS